jgi:hypothetical protein
MAMADYVELKEDTVACEFLLSSSLSLEGSMEFFTHEYPQVSFTTIRFHGGGGLMRAVGTPEDILKIGFDSVDGGRPPDSRFLLPVRLADPETVRDQLAKLVPDVQFRVSGRERIHADGPLESVDYARSLLWDLDVPPSPHDPATGR